MRVIRQIETGLSAQRGDLFGSVPVCLGIGIGVYFAIGQEPDIIQHATLGLGCLCVLVLSRLGPAAISPLLIGLALIGVGFGLAKTRTTIVIWMQTERPSVLIADNGALIGVLGQDGRALSRAKGSGFVASIWLENYGNPVDQARAAARRDFAKEGRITRFAIGDW